MTEYDDKYNSTDNIEELRKKWRSLSIEAPSSGGTPGEQHRLPLSQKQRIMMRLKCLSVAGVVFMIYFLTIIDTLMLPLWLTIAYELFMAIAIGVNIYQMRLLGKADFAMMTTVEAISFVKDFTRLRSRCKLYMILIAIPLVIVLLWIIAREHDPALQEGIVIGGISGGIIGGAIGFLIDRRFRKDLREMSRILGDRDD